MTTGEQFAGYQILFPCGHGAFGEVYLAEDMLGHRVALKVFSAVHAGEVQLQALRRYMQLPPHPAICQIYQCGMENGQLFYTMEAADNALGAESATYEPDTLAHRLAERKQFPIDEALKYCVSLVDALEVLHSAGLTHRDVKPENIIFVQGQLKIADFGLLADISQTLSLAGTLGFLPPELLAGKHVKGPLCDIYAVGKILYCSVTGKEPTEYPALPDNLPADTLRRLCIPAVRLCAKNPEKRCGTCHECRELLEEAAAGKAGPWRRFFGRLGMIPALGRRVAIFTLSAILLVGASCYGVSSYLRYRERVHVEAVARAQDALQTFRLATAKLPLQYPEYELQDVLAELDRLLAAEEFEAFHASLEAQRARLQKIAEEHTPALSQEGTPMERFQNMAEFYGFLDSPLAGFLPTEKRDGMRKEVDERSAELTPDQQSPRLGRSLHQMGWTGLENLNFVPPQAFYSSTKGGVQKIDYPFWVMDRKITNIFYRHKTKDSRNERVPDNDSVTNLNWNDMLNFCSIHGNSLNEYGSLPPGYGMRPPTEAEWELISTGGWSPNENPFNLTAILGIPGEVVLPYPETLEEERQKDILVIRGIDDGNRPSLTAHRIMYKDTWFVDYSSFRPVIAPMDGDFYQKQWQKNTVWRDAVVEGRHYCGHVTCIARHSYENTQNLAKLLGARLAEPSSLENLRAITEALKMIEYYPFFLGATYREGAWKWLSTNEKLDWPKLPTFLDEGTTLRALAGRGHGNFNSVGGESGLPAIVLEWPTEEDYNHRIDCWNELDKTPLLTSITLHGKKYALLHLRCSGLETIGLAKLLGTELAMLKDETALQELKEQFQETQEVIQLGGRRGYLWKMAWDDGSTTALPDVIPTFERHMTASSVVLDGLAVYRGKLVGSDVGTAILLEIPR